ncbi:MAG TPA: hypothetical protein VEW48_22350 [Thermoanaerobaculia bacterium]|nr:hypothetical protein [Thermoanaerobaculia bacterium]
MKKTAWMLAAAALLWTLPAYADRDEVVRHFVKQFPASDVDRVLVDVPVGEVIIEGSNDRQVELDVKLECDERGGACEELSKRVRVVYSRDGGDLTLRLKEWPKSRNKGLEAHVRVSVPRELQLKADLGVGELRIASLEGGVDADLGVGELNITMPAFAVASVNADAGIGEANLIAAGRRYESSGLIAREIRWNKGTGRARVDADCGVGEVNVKLTQ